MKNKLYLLILATIIMSSCTSTRLVNNWKDKETTIKPGTFNKYLVAAIVKDDVSRHTVEDKLVSMLKGKAMASYKYSNSDISKVSKDDINLIMLKDSFDCAIIMKLVDVDKDVQYTPGTFTTYPTYYRSFRGYYYRGWDHFNNPGYYTTTNTFSVETNFYDLKNDKLIWSGLTKSTNPTALEKMIDEIAKAVYLQMLSEGFVEK